MHNITKILKRKNLSFSEIGEIKKNWTEMIYLFKMKKAPFFINEVKNHLAPKRIKELEEFKGKNNQKFLFSLDLLNSEILIFKKFQLEEFSKIKVRYQERTSVYLNNSIARLSFELKDEKEFLKELIENIPDSKTVKLITESISKGIIKSNNS